MTQSDLIARFPSGNSIADRVLLVSPQSMPQLEGLAVHECRVFLLVTEGTLTVKVGTHLTRIEANSYVDMLVWEPIHFMAMTPDLRAWCLMPNYLFTNEALNGMKPADSESFKDRHAVPQMALEPEEAAVLERQLQLLAGTLADEAHCYRAELARTFFRSFMLEAGNIMHRRTAAGEEPDGIESRQDVIVRSFLKLVWKYYRSEHNIDFYAGKLCISAKHLSRVVRDKLGKTPYAVIRDELLQRAAYLLRDTKKPVQEIAGELHFSEMAAFCKFFKKHNAVSPTAYRATFRGGGAL